MDSKNVTLRIHCIILFFMITLFTSLVISDDLANDRDECSDQLVGLAPCLSFVGGDAKSPTLDCCTGLKGVLNKSKKCLCILVKDRDDPKLGFKINATLAMSLPDKCHAPANISQCPDLLHLAPNSPGAKIFDDFGRSVKGSNADAPAGDEVKGSPNGEARKADVKSDGGKRKRMFVIGLFVSILNHM